MEYFKSMLGAGRTIAPALVCLMLLSISAFAQDPGSALGTQIQTMFTGPLAIALTIVAIVIGGCLIAFGGGAAIRVLGGVLIGAILILDAVKLTTWIQTLV